MDGARAAPARFDLVLLDPPFDAPRCRCRRSRRRARLVAPGGFVYVEAPQALEPSRLAAPGSSRAAQGRAGAVHFHLLRRAWPRRRGYTAAATSGPRSASLTSVTRLTAVYPGTFDPMTLGHEDLMRRASRLFERLIVAVAAGHHKRTMFTIAERLEIASELSQPATRTSR